MWFRFSRPDYFYVGHYHLVDAGDDSAWNRGLSIGFGVFVLNMRWNNGRSESEGVHYPAKPRLDIVVNGDRMPIAREVLSYESVCALAGERRGATVTYWDNKSGRKGSLAPGEKVLVTDGMVFNAVMTGRA